MVSGYRAPEFPEQYTSGESTGRNYNGWVEKDTAADGARSLRHGTDTQGVYWALMLFLERARHQTYSEILFSVGGRNSCTCRIRPGDKTCTADTYPSGQTNLRIISWRSSAHASLALDWFPFHFRASRNSVPHLSDILSGPFSSHFTRRPYNRNGKQQFRRKCPLHSLLLPFQRHVTHRCVFSASVSHTRIMG